MILGIVGGVFALAGAFFGLLLDSAIVGLSESIGEEAQADTAFAGAFLLGMLGILGGALAMVKTRIAAVTMLVSAIWGMAIVGGFFLLGGAILFVGGVLALISGFRKTAHAVSSAQ
jgi:hypothetical protein